MLGVIMGQKISLSLLNILYLKLKIYVHYEKGNMYANIGDNSELIFARTMSLF